MDSLGEHPSTSALEELQFYTKQAALVRDIVEHKDLRPGRGYVGFDTFGSASNSWQAARDAN
jgi:hypothetical protein